MATEYRLLLRDAMFAEQRHTSEDSCCIPVENEVSNRFYACVPMHVYACPRKQTRTPTSWARNEEPEGNSSGTHKRTFCAGEVDGPAPGTQGPRDHRHPLFLPLSLALLISLSPHLFSPPHAGPQWVIWLEYPASTKYEYPYTYGEEYRESKI